MIGFFNCLIKYLQSHKMSQTVQYGYLNFQGRGQIARLLLVYTKTNFTEKLYSFSKMNEWVEDKNTLGLDFPSMPYLIDGKFKLTESKAIEKYILHRAKKTEMLGRNNKERAFIDNIDGVLRDIFSGIIGLLSAPDFEESRKKLFETVEQKLNYLNSCIGGKDYLLDRLTYVDFVLNVVYGYFRLFYPHEYSKWGKIERVYQNVNQLPQVAAYYKSSECISALLPSEWASNPKFINIRPLSELIQEVSIQAPIVTPPEQIRPEPIIVNVQQRKIEIVSSLQKNHKHLEQVERSHEHPKQVEQAPVIKKIESIQEPKHFTSRVSEYIKAAQSTNQKTSSEVKQGLQTSTIVTPSKLESSIKSSASGAFWKVNTEQTSNTNKPQETSSIVLGYWGIRGLGQVQRHLLTYCGHEFSQKIYKTREEWFSADKLTLNLPFPNLPYLISGDLKITESLAIDRYIIRTSNKHELLGKNLKDQTYIQNFVKILAELFAEIRVLCFTEEQQQKKTDLLGKLNLAFSRLDQFIKDENFTFGYLTWVDFYIAQISYYIEKIFPEIFSSYGFLKKIRDSVTENEQIQKYYTRNASVSAPFMPPSAKISF